MLSILFVAVVILFSVGVLIQSLNYYFAHGLPKVFKFRK